MNKNVQGCSYKQTSYKLFKEGYIQRLFVKANVKIRWNEKSKNYGAHRVTMDVKNNL